MGSPPLVHAARPAGFLHIGEEGVKARGGLIIIVLLVCNLLLLLRINSKLPRRDRVEEAVKRAKERYNLD